jgi:hypothetical protein
LRHRSLIIIPTTMSISDEFYPFPKLNDNNYTSWSTRMRAVLIKKNCWSLVSGTEILSASADASKRAAFKKRQDEAYSELILAVEDSQLPHMDSDDPKVIWDELAKVHHAGGLSTQLAAVRKFVRMEKKADQSMSSWIGEVRALTQQLERVQIKLPDIFPIVVLTAGLPQEYEPVVVALDGVDKLTLDVAIARLLNEEERQRLMAKYRSSAIDPKSTENAACAARTPNVTMCISCGK